MWITYKWKKGDSFDKLAKTSKVKNADIILNFPKNKEVLKLHKAKKEIPVGTQVWILDPKAKIYKTKVNGKDVYFGEPELKSATAAHTKLMKGFVAGFDAQLAHLKGSHDQLNAAIKKYWMVGFLYSEGNTTEPKSQLKKAQASLKKLTKISKTDKVHEFYDQLGPVEKDCEAYQKALQAWLKAMQTNLNWSLGWLGTANQFATGAATVMIVTACAPASIPAAILYGALAGNAVSLVVDGSKTITAVAVGDKPPALSEVLGNSISAMVVGGISGGLFSAIFKVFGPAAATYLCSTKVVQNQAIRFAGEKWVVSIVETAGRAMTKPEIVKVVTTAMLKTIGRLGMTGINKYLGSATWVKEKLLSYAKSNPDKVSGKKPEETGSALATGVLDTRTCDIIFDELIQANKSAFETDLISEVEKLQK
ncbi:MAG: hypothetical protein L3J36_02660 [Rhodobacteraceae bacterium]|nr:hypothetical protein [Paracoccaceae bacterium]